MPTLHWVGKEKVVNHHHDVPFRLLDKQYSFAAKADNSENTTDNRIVHGDNLEVLKSLLPEFEGKVNCIYIDPPYNTGNESWVYNDNVNDPKIKKWLGQVVGKEGEDLSRHDKWLCMMYPRLKLLHRLLAQDGVIFVSIDDNEFANVKLLMDEVFGAGGIIANLCWQKRVSPANDAKYFSSDHEYVVVYAKNKSAWTPNKLGRTEAQLNNYKNPDNDSRGAWNSVTYTCNKSADERPNLYYSIVNPNTGDVIYPKKTAVWKYDESKHSKNVQEGLIYWGADGNSKMPRLKRFLNEMGDVVPRSILFYNEFGHTQEARTELLNILEDSPFTTPKPSRLIEKILSIGTGKNSIILDSFAGSGTTAHAVLKLNTQDGGSRRFILCEMMDYAETITAERVRRVINGYGEGNKAVPGTGGGFNYYTVGQRLFDDNKNLNEAVGKAAIHDYVAYTESITSAQRWPADNPVSPYALGASDTALWVFYYEPSRITTLDIDFLGTLNLNAHTAAGHPRPSQFIIYADKCALDVDFLNRYNITFKRIPRDITKF